MEQALTIETPVGRVTIRACDNLITAIRFGGPTPGDRAQASSLLQQAALELEEYFAGRRRKFTFPLSTPGTEFQQTVWAALKTIPYGETRTYKQIAGQIGHPKSFRAVGMANNRNPHAIVVPCHRVVGCDKTLTGYAGGLEVKARLLELEMKG